MLVKHWTADADPHRLVDDCNCDRLYESRIQVEWIGVITFSLGEVGFARGDGDSPAKTVAAGAYLVIQLLNARPAWKDHNQSDMRKISL
jgi:hypothetical protein